MRATFVCLVLVLSTSNSSAKDLTFSHLLKRTVQRDAITKAILSIDGLSFKMSAKEDTVSVTLSRGMKGGDPNPEKYTLALTPAIEQELIRLQLLKDLVSLKARCSLAERTYRIQQYKGHNLKLGMPLKEAKAILGASALERTRRAALGSATYYLGEYRFDFIEFRLFDITQVKGNSNKDGSANR